VYKFNEYVVLDMNVLTEKQISGNNEDEECKEK
jgi:hypothetical protein